jgi:acyl-CoA synthetase (NDP forming)
VGIVTVSGGAGILMADAAVRAGLAVPALRGDDRARIAALIPGFGAADNPVDCTGQVVNDRRLLGTVLQALAETSSLDSLCLFLGLADPLDERLAAPVVEVAATTPKAVAAWCGSAQAAATMTERGVPTYTDPTRAMRALGALARWASRTGADELGPHTACHGSGPALRLVAADHPFLLEHTALALLASLGLRVPRTRVVRSEDEASTAAAELDWPLALKALSYDLPHRSDAGGVQLGLRSEHELRDAYRAIVRSVAEKAPAARLEAMLVAEMAPGGLELACGMRRDPTFGPMVGVGLGGYAVEIIGEMALRRAPLTEAEALRALADVHGGRLIRSRRGPSRQQQADIARVLVTLGDLAVREPTIQEIDLNPVIAAADGSVWVVDALVLLTPASG